MLEALITWGNTGQKDAQLGTINVLDLKKDSVLIVKVPNQTSMYTKANVADIIQKIIPHVKVLVLEKEIELEIINESSFRAVSEVVERASQALGVSVEQASRAIASCGAAFRKAETSSTLRAAIESLARNAEGR